MGEVFLLFRQEVEEILLILKGMEDGESYTEKSVEEKIKITRTMLRSDGIICI